MPKPTMSNMSGAGVIKQVAERPKTIPREKIPIPGPNKIQNQEQKPEENKEKPK